jgi:hypothetical protein
MQSPDPSLEKTMKPAAIATLILAVAAVCLLAVASQPRESQAQLQATADGATLEAKARRALNALTGQSPGGLWAEIAPWQQNALRLQKAQIQRAVESEPVIWQAEAAELKNLDPRDRFPMESPAGLRALSDQDYFGLRAGIYRLEGADGAAASMAGEWFAVDRKVGLGQHQTRGGNVEVFILQTMGTITFENLEGSRVTVVAVAEGNQWFITEVGWQLSIGREGRGSLSAALGKERSDLSGPVEANTADAKRSEGEQMLGTMRNRARVHYAKTGNPPETLMEAGIEANERTGRYYTVRDNVWSSDTFTVLAADANDGGGACVIVYFKMESGQSQIEHFDSKAEMTRRIDELLKEPPSDE